MANNPALYNAIIAGITAGNQQRWLLPDAINNFTIFNTILETIATYIDAQIPPNDINDSQADLMQSICQGVFTNQSIETVRHQLPNVAGYIALTFNELTTILEPIEEDLIPGIEAGTFFGQLAHWDGEKWAPLPNTEPALLNGFTNSEENMELTFDGTTGNIVFGVNGGAEDLVDNEIQYIVHHESQPAQYTLMSIKPDVATLKAVSPGGTASYSISPTEHDFKIGIDSLLKIVDDEGVRKIGFFGVPPSARHTITNGTDAQIQDQIIIALAAYGLVIDGRS